MTTNTKSAIIAFATALVVAGGLWLMLPAKTPIVGASFGTTNNAIDGSQATLPNPSNYDYLVARLSLGLGTQTSVSSTGAGNVNLEAQRQLLTTGTTTPCALLNPFNATSTITGFAYTITTSTSTAITYAVGTSTTAYATSTGMANVVVGANAQATISWDGGINNSVIGPGQYIVVGQNGTGFTTGIVTAGACSATFQTAN